MLLASKISPPKIAKVDFCLSASMIPKKTSIRTAGCFIINKPQFSLKMEEKESPSLKNRR